MKIEIDVPFYMKADDYHEFGYLQDTLNNLINADHEKVEYEELDVHDRYYHAMFYTGSELQEENLKFIKSCIKDLTND